jgi:hypothetical protein
VIHRDRAAAEATVCSLCSLCQHDWSSIRADPEMHGTEASNQYARDQAFRFTSYRALLRSVHRPSLSPPLASRPMLKLVAGRSQIIDTGHDAIFSLRYRDVPVAYVPFAGEQHGYRRAENIQRALDTELFFYGRVFGFEPANPVEPVIIETPSRVTVGASGR